MTELEKAESGNYNEVDLNRLAEEIGGKNKAFMELCFGAVKKGGGAFDAIDIREHPKPAHDMLLALNAFLCRIGVKEPMIAHMAAALMHQSETILRISEHEQVNRELAFCFAEILKESVTTYSMLVEDKSPEREVSEERSTK